MFMYSSSLEIHDGVYATQVTYVTKKLCQLKV